MSPSQNSLKLNYTAASDRGLVRTNNEDSAFAGRNLLVLADGMGCLLYTSPSPRDVEESRMPSSA